MTRYITDLLNSPVRLFDKAQKARELTEILEAQATKTTTRLTGMPGGGGSDKEQLLARLADARMEWGWYTQLRIEAVDFVRNLIRSSPLNDREKELLLMRYIDNCPWSVIYNTIKWGGMISERTMYRMKNNAIDELDKYFVLGGYHEEDTNFVQASL